MSNTTRNKYHWYILVLTDKGPKFVTKLGANRTAYWGATDKPLEVSKEWANDICIGLTWNGYLAYPVCTTYEISSQPYMYDKGAFEWHWNDSNIVYADTDSVKSSSEIDY